MRLAEIIATRPLIGSGLLVTVTGRCPLHCATCPTGSTMRQGQADAAGLLHFFGTFTPEHHPAVVVLSGGEPLLRPRLVTQLAELAAVAGSRTAVRTGAFFAIAGRVPEQIWRAADAVDHIAIGIDACHEREVPRAAVFRLLGQLSDRRVPASLHIVGQNPADPYLASVITEVRERFGDQVPMLVTVQQRAGRAALWAMPPQAGAPLAQAQPCTVASWPVVAVDGTVTACGNPTVGGGSSRPAQVLVRRSVPEHLVLGQARVDTWAQVHQRLLTAPILRMIRTLGPARLPDPPAPVGPGTALPATAGTALPAAAEVDMCGTCRRLSEGSAGGGWGRRTAAGPLGELLDWQAARRRADAGPVGVVQGYGCARYADLVSLDALVPGTSPS